MTCEVTINLTNATVTPISCEPGSEERHESVSDPGTLISLEQDTAEVSLSGGTMDGAMNSESIVVHVVTVNGGTHNELASHIWTADYDGNASSDCELELYCATEEIMVRSSILVTEDAAMDGIGITIVPEDTLTVGKIGIILELRVLRPAGHIFHHIRGARGGHDDNMESLLMQPIKSPRWQVTEETYDGHEDTGPEWLRGTEERMARMELGSPAGNLRMLARIEHPVNKDTLIEARNEYIHAPTRKSIGPSVN